MIAAAIKVSRLMAILLLIGASAPVLANDRPNIVVVLVDDAGFMDFGGFGGEARTPAIDALGDRGVRFSNYHTSPLCAPSRAMLLTGLDNHRAGVATIPEVITSEQEGRSGYSLHFEQGVHTLADKLKASGYRTYMTGKWHLGDAFEELPVSHGFDRSFALAASGADNFEQKSYMPYYKTAPWFEDGEPAQLPEDFYSSAFIVDKMSEYVRTDESDAPFFSYLAFQAIHIPIQAPESFIERYAGEYDEGWDALRERRWRRGKETGLIHKDAPLAPIPDTFDAWDSLGADEKRYYAKSMQVNAAMLEAMDFHFGRFIDFLRKRGELDNTLFVVTSDNGPEFNEPALRPPMKLWMAMNGYTNEVESLGEPGSLAHIGPEWANAAASPGRLFKFYATEGGLRVPLIVAGSGVVSQPGFTDAAAFVTDIAPTILEAAAVAPGVASRGRSMDGVSLMPVLSGDRETAGRTPRTLGIEVSGNAALFHGDYKLTRTTLPHGENRWRLYNIVRDPGETKDLSAGQPALFADMKQRYAEYVEYAGVIEPPASFNPVQQIVINTFKRQLTFYWHWLAAGLIGLVVLIGYGIVRWRGRRE